MSQRRLVVWGVAGAVLSAFVAGAFWIHRLQQRLAGLEREVAALEAAADARVPVAQVVPVASPQVETRWITRDNEVVVTAPQRFADGTPLPQGTTTPEINGMPYYIMPLSDANGIAPLTGRGSASATRR